MKKIGIFYGSNTGCTADAASRIGSALGVQIADIHDVAKVAPSVFGDYDVLVLGSSTWGDGELQDDWYDFLAGAQALDLTGKEIALFGCGDESMTDTFCSAIGKLYDALKGTGARFIGQFDADGFHFDHSGAMVDGKIVGLMLDDVNHADLTQSRIERWAGQLKEEM